MKKYIFLMVILFGVMILFISCSDEKQKVDVQKVDQKKEIEKQKEEKLKCLEIKGLHLGLSKEIAISKASILIKQIWGGVKVIELGKGITSVAPPDRIMGVINGITLIFDQTGQVLNKILFDKGLVNKLFDSSELNNEEFKEKFSDLYEISDFISVEEEMGSYEYINYAAEYKVRLSKKSIILKQIGSVE